jgi:hypothetical protein
MTGSFLRWDFFVSSNQIEALFWILIGLAFAIAALRQRDVNRNRCLQAAVAFVVCGLSDIVEARTGAWWRPWWLLVWKVGSFVWLGLLLIDHWRRKARN